MSSLLRGLIQLTKALQRVLAIPDGSPREFTGPQGPGEQAQVALSVALTRCPV